jgi:hypothetical protein
MAALLRSLFTSTPETNKPFNGERLEFPQYTANRSASFFQQNK